MKMRDSDINIKEGIGSYDRYHCVWVPDEPKTMVLLPHQKKVDFSKNLVKVVIVMSFDEYIENYEYLKSLMILRPVDYQIKSINNSQINEFIEKMSKNFIEYFNIMKFTKMIFICSGIFVRRLFSLVNSLELSHIVEIRYVLSNKISLNTDVYRKAYLKKMWFKSIEGKELLSNILKLLDNMSQSNIYNNFVYRNFIPFSNFMHENVFLIINSNYFLKRKTNSKILLKLLCELELNSSFDIDRLNILKFKQECENDHEKILENIITKYVQESFIHKIMNKMLMSHFKLDEIYYIQPLYVALFSKIKEIYKKQQSGAEKLKKYPQKNLTNFTCYRGAMLNISEFNVFPSYEGQIISHLNFLSTSYDILVAANFMANALIVINVSSAKKRNEEVDYGFAFIEDYTNSQMVVEKEVLFNSMSTYRVVEVIKQKDLLLSSKRHHTEKIKQILQKNDLEKIVNFLEYGAAAEIYHQIQNQEQIDEIREPMNLEKKIFEYMQQKQNNNQKIIERAKINYLFGFISEINYLPVKIHLLFGLSNEKQQQELKIWIYLFIIHFITRMVITKNLFNIVSQKFHTSNSQLTFNSLSTSQTLSTSSSSQTTSFSQHSICLCFSKNTSLQKLISTLQNTPKPNQLSPFLQLLQFLSPKSHPLKFESHILSVKNQNKQIYTKFKLKKQQYICTTCLSLAQSKLLSLISNLTSHMIEFFQNKSTIQPTSQITNISSTKQSISSLETLPIPPFHQLQTCISSSLSFQPLISQKFTSFEYYFDDNEQHIHQNLPEFPNVWILSTLYQHSALDDYIYSKVAETLTQKIVNEKVQINQQTISYWTKSSLYQQFPQYLNFTQNHKFGDLCLTPHIPLHYILQALWVCEAINGTCLKQVEQEIHPKVRHLTTQDPSILINMQLIQQVTDQIIN